MNITPLDHLIKRVDESMTLEDLKVILKEIINELGTTATDVTLLDSKVNSLDEKYELKYETKDSWKYFNE